MEIYVSMWRFLDKNFIEISNFLFGFLSWVMLCVPIFADEFQVIRGICILVHEPLYNCEIVLFFCFLCVFIVSFLACYSLMQTHVSTKKNLLKVIIVFIFIEIVLYSFAGIKLARELSGDTYSPYLLIVLVPLLGYGYDLQNQ